jgi:hypothetical protein
LGSEERAAQLSQVLATLPNLRRLQMRAYDLPYTVQQLSHLTALQDLSLSYDLQLGGASRALHGLAHVPQLTALELRLACRALPGVVAPITSGTFPSAALTGLRKLKLLSGAGFEPDLLSSWPSL